MKKILAIFLLIFVIGIVMIINKRNQPPQTNISYTVDYSDQPEATPTPQPTNTPTATSTPTIQNGPYPMEIDKTKNYQAIVDSSLGIFKIELFASQTPITVNNFVALSRRKFYNNTIFHRVIKGFMIQGGDPGGNGSGGPGYNFADEPFTGEYTRSTLAMANAGPNTNGSQFFIMHQDYALDKNYVIFGKVIQGMEVIDKIAESPTEVGPGGENSKPINPTIIKSIQILEL